jgi:ABC-type nitrate/sulfonate/bicarbonate transport system permease component
MIRLAQIGSILAALGLWELVVKVGGISNRVLAAPSEAFTAMAVILADPRVQEGIWITTQELVLATVFAVPAGVVLGFLVGESVAARRVLAPVLYVGTAIPKSLFLPLFILVLGIGMNQKVVFGVVQAFFVVAVSTLVAVQGVPSGLTLVGRALRASRAQMYFKIYLPYMLPVILQGVRVGVIYAAGGILFAEMYAARGGLGRMINIWGASYDLPKMLAGAILAAVGAIAVNSALRYCEGRVGRWRGVGTS